MSVSGFQFRGEAARVVKRELSKYPRERRSSAVLSLLDLAQRQNDQTHSITGEAIDHIANLLDMPRMRVWEIASFYSMLHSESMGRYHVQLCRTTPCMLCEAESVREAVLSHLGIGLGETTADGLFTVSEVECLGACVDAPVVQIGDDYYERQTPQSIVEVLESFKQKGKTKKSEGLEMSLDRYRDVVG